ncbi:hypothetical protein [Pyrococcus kukulkanii]|uniref:Membrane protein n=1 Tax=Pyrococcus kukulkanii TaxID=1609559 RepID=A0A127B6P9_9EURY|nr:hypothetical protein [Pyrococcus kukulkanii]AMM53061.1 membrane protein [Pyrococcus kukulkanii]
MIDHYTLGYLTFAFMNLTMLSGALIFLGRKKKFWTYTHVALAVITYILMTLTIWVVR